MESIEFAEPYYEEIEYDLATGSTLDQLSLNSKTNQTGTFGDIFGSTKPMKFATRMTFRTDQTVTLYLNKSTNHPITVASTDSPFSPRGIEIRDLFVTNNSGSTAHIKVLLYR